MRRWLIVVSLAAMIWVIPKPTVAQQNGSKESTGTKPAQHLTQHPVDVEAQRVGVVGVEETGRRLLSDGGHRPVPGNETATRRDPHVPADRRKTPGIVVPHAGHVPSSSSR